MFSTTSNIYGQTVLFSVKYVPFYISAQDCLMIHGEFFQFLKLALADVALNLLKAMFTVPF